MRRMKAKLCTIVQVHLIQIVDKDGMIIKRFQSYILQRRAALIENDSYRQEL